MEVKFNWYVKNIGYINSASQPIVKSKDGREITWTVEYFIPYTAKDAREYDKNENNPDYLTVRFKPIAQRNETAVTYFETADNYADIFVYYLPRTARDDIYIENRN